MLYSRHPVRLMQVLWYSIAAELDTFFHTNFLCVANIFEPPVDPNSHRLILYSTTTVILQHSTDMYHDTLFIHILICMYSNICHSWKVQFLNV